MRHVLKRKMKRAFEKYKQMTFLSTSGHEKMKRCVTKMANWRLRVAFDWWRKQDEKLALCDENYYTGNVRVDHWEADREIMNLREFMRSERFTEDEINAKVKKVADRNDQTMIKYYKRWYIQTNTSDKKIMPWFFDRWKKYVQLKKLYKYAFRVAYNMT